MITPDVLLAWVIWAVAVALLAKATHRPIRTWMLVFGFFAMIAMVVKSEPELDERMPYHRILSLGYGLVVTVIVILLPPMTW